MIKSFNSWKEINESLVNGVSNLSGPAGKSQKITVDVINKNTFVYTLRTNNTTYLLEYDKEDNLIDAEAIEGSGPDGTLEYTNEGIVFYPEVKEASTYILLTNQQDKHFFTNIFTDPNFRSSSLD